MVRSEHCRFPNLSFLQLAITKEYKGIPILLRQTRGEREANRPRRTRTERAVYEISHRGALGADRLELGAVHSVGRELRGLDQAGFGGHGVKTDCVVARRKNEPVIAGANNAAPKQYGENLCGRHGLTEIAKTLDRDHSGRV